jgi:hypothetical protein
MELSSRRLEVQRAAGAAMAAFKPCEDPPERGEERIEN